MWCKRKHFQNAVMQEVIPQGIGEVCVCLECFCESVCEEGGKKEQWVITCQANVVGTVESTRWRTNVIMRVK